MCDLTISVLVIIPTILLSSSTTGILEIPLLNMTLDASLIDNSGLATTNLVLINPSTVSAHSLDTTSNAVTIPTNLSFSNRP